jgi:hypothetical protein
MMKVTGNPVPVFNPVSITIEFETSGERDVFRAIMNCVPITKSAKSLVPSFDDEGIREAVGEATDEHMWGKFMDRLERKMRGM